MAEVVTWLSVMLRAGAVALAWGLLLHYAHRLFLLQVVLFAVLFFHQLLLSPLIPGPDWWGLGISIGLLLWLVQLQRLLEDERQVRRELLRELEAREQWLAQAYHTLRTPTHVIIGFVEMIEDRDVLTVEDREYLRRIKQAGRALAEAIDHLPDLKRSEQPPCQSQK
jgi:signal transduction histidine kinase